MTKTKSILIIIFSIFCVAIGILSPYFIAGVNKQALQDNELNITAPEYENIDIGSSVNISLTKDYLGIKLPRGYKEGKIFASYDIGDCICGEQSEIHYKLPPNQYILLTDLNYTVLVTNNNGDVIDNITKCLKGRLIVNDYNSVDLLLETYNDADELILSETIKNIAYTDTFYADGSVKHRTFNYLINIENLDQVGVILILDNLDNPNFDGYIHN